MKYEVTASQFQNLKAVVTVTADKAVPADVTVALELKESTFPEGSLSFAETVLVKQGAKEAKAEVSLNADLLEYETDYKAVFSASVDKVKIGKDITLTYTTGEYPTLTVAQIVALMPAENKATVDFKGKLSDVVVAYANGSNCFIEDATGAILLYKKDHGYSVGKKLSGLFIGKVQNFNGLPEISDLDLTGIKAEDGGEVAAPKEMTVAQLNQQFDQILNHRVKLTGVTASADIQNKINAGYEITQGEDKIILYLQNNLSSVIEAGSTFDVVGFVTPYNAVKQIKIFEDNAISNVVAPGPKVERVWGLYNSGAEVDWFKDIDAGGAKLAATTDRNIAMDDDYIYFAKSSSYPAILAVDKNNPTDATKSKKLNIDGIAGGTHAISCVRIVKNTDASVNGGKDILLVSNLKGDYELKVYAYLNGIDAAPTQVLIWQWDNHANASDWRRYGDKFTVTGTWQSGAIWFQGWSDGKALYFPVKNGTIEKPNEVSHVIDPTASAIKDIAVYPGQESEILVTSYNKAAFWTNSGNKNANNWVTWDEGAAMDNLKNSYGYNFFEFNNKKYIAYTLVEDTTHSRLQVMEDTGAFKASLDAKEGLFELPLQNADDFKTASPAAGGNNGDCTVRVIGDEVYILAMHTDCGLSLFKMSK